MSIRDDLKAYLDGELSESRAAEVRAALESDPNLRKEADRIQAISKTLQLANLDFAPVGLDKTLGALKQAAVKPSLSPWRMGGWVLAGGVAAAVLAAVIFPWAAHPKMAYRNDALAVRTTRTPEISSVAAAPTAPVEQSPQNEVEPYVDESGKSIGFKAKAPASKARAVQPPAATQVHEAPLAEAKQETADTVATGPLPPSSSGGGGRGVANAPAASSLQKEDAAHPVTRGETQEPKSAAVSALAAPMNFAAKAARDRLIVNNGDVGVYVADVIMAKSKAEGFTRSAGGYVETSDLQGDKPANQVASLKLRVPVDGYSKVLQQIKGLGTVNRDASTGTDVSAQVVDTEARLRTMRSEEAQYLEIMKHAKKIDDVLQVKDKLNDVREQIESLDAQAKNLRGQAALSTITVSFSVKAKERAFVAPPSWIAGTLYSAFDSLKEVGKAMVTLVIFMLVFLPVWAPVAALSLWGYKASRPEYRY